MAEAGKSIIRLEHVTKRFGKMVAVDDVSLTIEEGEFFALLGPSGCGKTTLLRMVAGFETPTEGRIFIDGEDVSRTPPNRRPVNMVFQSYAVFPHMTPGLVAGGLLAFTLSLDDFVITFFTSGPETTTFPIKVYSMVRFSVTPEVNAASTILIVITVLLTFIALRLQGTDVARNAAGGA